MSHIEIESERLREKGSTTPTSSGGSQIQEKDGSVSLKYPMLTRSNYAAWSIKMEVFMRAQGVWEAVEATEPVDTKKDMMALAAIYQGISEDTLLQLGAKKSAKEAWNIVKTMNLGAEKVKEVRTQSLWREFEAMKMSDGDNIDDFSGKLQIVVNKLRGLGNNVEEEQVVKKLLRSTSSKFLQIASTIEEFGDLKTKTVDEVIGSLKAHEERLQGSGTSRDQTVLLSRSEWKVREDRKSQQKDFRKLSNIAPVLGRGRGQVRGRGRGNFYGGGSQRKQEEPQQRRWFDKANVKCYRCGKTGHCSWECSTQKDEQANLIEENQEPAMLMIETCELTKSQDSYVKTEDEPRGCAAQTESRWYLDTGASNHMTGEKGFFADIDYSVNGNVRFGDGSVTEIHGLGSVLFQCKNGEHLTLSNVYYIPKLKSNIISLGQLDERGSRVIIEEGTLRVYDRTRRLVFNVRRQQNKLFTVNLQTAQKVCLVASIADKDWLWHARYGHLNFQALRSLKKMVKGMPEIAQVNKVCDGCVIGKQHRVAFPQKSVYRATQRLELVHGDLCGPITPATPGGNKYFLLLVDDYSRFMWVTLLKDKSEAFEAFKKFKSQVENEVGEKLKCFRTDRGGEFTSIEFNRFCDKEGVKRHLTAPYSPQQNGVVERRNQTVMEMARSIMKSKQMPAKFWEEAVTTSVYILNRAPTKSVEQMTPYEAWSGKTPSVQHLRVFGCVAHAKVVSSNLTKLDDRSIKCVMLGYVDGTKAYRLLDPVKERIIVSRDVIFEEDKSWSWLTDQGDEQTDSGGTFTVQHRGRDADQMPIVQEGNETATPVQVSPQSTPRTSSVSSSDEEQQNLRSLQEIYDATREIDAEAGLCFLSIEEPATYTEAVENRNWREAMSLEFSSILQNGTWELSDLPRNHKAIGLKWVYKLKKDPEGKIIKHKARLVAKGYVQKYGVDYKDVFAPVARMETVRTLLAYSAQRMWNVHHMDVKTAFLNGELKEEVYVAQPEGFVDAENPDKVLKLHKALYGLKQAPRAWNEKLDKCLNSLCFTRCPIEYALYVRRTEENITIVGVYVDDLIITGSSEDAIKEFKQEMLQKFEMSDLGLLSYYLGIEVVQDREAITLCQSGYATKILEKMGMADCNSCPLPMEPRCKLSKHDEEPLVDATVYRSIVGSLRYLVNTRPDLAYSVGIVSRYMEAPTTTHMAAVKQILRYVRGTLNTGCVYKKDQANEDLIGYSDSDMAGDVDDRKSTTGIIFFLGESPITWVSQKQRIVALSSCEAEYIAATGGACQGIWLKRLMESLRGDAQVKPILKVDNKSAIALAKNPVQHDRSKHIDTRYHFIRECVENGDVKLEYTRTENQLADILTKPLGRQRFNELKTKIGMSIIKGKQV